MKKANTNPPVLNILIGYTDSSMSLQTSCAIERGNLYRISHKKGNKSIKGKTVWLTPYSNTPPSSANSNFKRLTAFTNWSIKTPGPQSVYVRILHSQ